MPSRVEKNYNKSRTNKRTVKNQKLYDSINNPEYKVISSTSIIFNEIEEPKDEQQESPSILKTEKLTSLIMDVEKERDINKILKDAKSTRRSEDDLEKKRKLDKKEYNITKKINVDDEQAVAKFRNQNKKVVENEEELSDLIDTIYNKKDSANLLDDLMPSSIEETIVSDDQTNEFIVKENKNKKVIENSFFTNSIELMSDDLVDDVCDEEEEIFFEDNEKTSVLKVVCVIAGVIIFIAVLGFVIYEYFLKI